MGWVEGMRAKGLKPGTVNRALNLFKASMTKAVEWEMEGMTESPARTVKPLADHARVERFLSPQESHALMDAVQKSSNPMLYPLIGFLLLTGSRKSEAFNLKPEHINESTRVWTVRPRLMCSRTWRLAARCATFSIAGNRRASLPGCKTSAFTICAIPTPLRS